MKEVLIVAAVFLGCAFALPGFFPSLEHVAFHIGNIAVRYVHIITAAMCGLTIRVVY